MLKSLIPWQSNARSLQPQKSMDPFVSFRQAVDRMFDDFFEGFGHRALSAGQGGSMTPTIDVADQDNALVVTAELPGLDENDFEVTLAGDVLTIKGEKKSETENNTGGAYYLERRYGAFSRSLRLPFEAPDEGIEARYDKGVLTIKVPKPAEAKQQAKRIEVKAH